MADSSDGVVVTERMLTEAARAGDLEQLRKLARQGGRVTTLAPLVVAVEGGHCQLEVLRCLVQELGANVNQLNGDTPLTIAAPHGSPPVVRCLVELGADVNQATQSDGRTALIIAARFGKLAVVRCLIQLGARIEAVDCSGVTALLQSVRSGHYDTAQYLLEEAGANMDDVSNYGDNVWKMLIEHFEEIDDYGIDEADLAVLIGLLRVMVLRGAPPPVLVALLARAGARTRVVQEGARLRARLPAYLAHRRAYLDSRCPRISLLPGVLRALICTFEGPATTKELWATGLGQAP
jgi:hypothetical protein